MNTPPWAALVSRLMDRHTKGHRIRQDTQQRDTGYTADTSTFSGAGQPGPSPYIFVYYLHKIFALILGSEPVPNSAVK